MNAFIMEKGLILVNIQDANGLFGLPQSLEGMKEVIPMIAGTLVNIAIKATSGLNI